MTVDLLICNYNTKDKLERLLESLNSDYEPGVWKLFIADNDSRDGSLEFLLENKEKYGIQAVMANPNVGYAGAINALANLGQSEVLCAVNADTWFDTSDVKAAMQTFVDHPNQAIMGPKQMDESYKIRHGGITWDGLKEHNPVHRGWNIHDTNDEFFKDRIQCWTVSGSIYYVRRSVWAELTRDPEYRRLYPTAMGPMLDTPLYFEETFLSVFAQKRGYEVWYDGTIPTVGHTWHASNTPGDNVSMFHYSKEIYRRTCDEMAINHEIK